MIIQGLFTYVYWSSAIGMTVCGLMNGKNKEVVIKKIAELHPDACAIRVGLTSDNRPADVVHYTETSGKAPTCFIFGFIDVTTGGFCSGIDCMPEFHPEIYRDFLQHYYPNARGIIVEEVSDDELPPAKAMKAKYQYA